MKKKITVIGFDKSTMIGLRGVGKIEIEHSVSVMKGLQPVIIGVPNIGVVGLDDAIFWKSLGAAEVPLVPLISLTNRTTDYDREKVVAELLKEADKDFVWQTLKPKKKLAEKTHFYNHFYKPRKR